MAEAGMVGGLADWFAVEALFRHPLGLPIPHTALLPKNQKRAANNIAGFIDEHFMVPDQLLRQVQQINVVRKVALWAAERKNAATLALEMSKLIHLILRTQLRGQAGSTSVEALRGLLLQSVNSNLLAKQISTLLKGSLHGQLLDDILMQVRDVLDQNRGKVLSIVQDRSRWWIASTVDRRIVVLLVDGILSIIDELTDDRPQLREEFKGSIAGLVDRFQQTGQISKYVESGLRDFADSDDFVAALTDLITRVLEEIDQSLTSDPGRIETALSEAVVEFAHAVLRDADLEEQLNSRLLSAVETLLEEMRPMVIQYVSTTIAEWDSKELVARMEGEVGRDLQFIRINGAVLGSLVGGTLFAITHVLFLN
jgi:uncharacterized membrane-anchored protein YjiN (DUF445 family)